MKPIAIQAPTLLEVKEPLPARHKRVEKAIAPAAASKGRRKRQVEKRKRVGKLTLVKNLAVVGACLRKQKCLRSRVCLGEDLTLKLPGNGLGGWGLPPANGGAGVVQGGGSAPGCGSASHEGAANSASVSWVRRPAASERRRPPSRALDCGGLATLTWSARQLPLSLDGL